MVMVLVGRKAAPQRMWLHLLFHVIPVIEASHPPVFSHKDTQLLLTRLQVSHTLPSSLPSDHKTAVIALALIVSYLQLLT